MEKSISATLYQCTLCTLKFPFDKVKYSKDGKRLICVECYNKILKKDQKDEEARQRKEARYASQPEGEAVKVMCVNCSYKFFYRPKPHLKPKCPYCSGNKIRRYEELTAEKLLNEASKSDFERRR